MSHNDNHQKGKIMKRILLTIVLLISSATISPAASKTFTATWKKYTPPTGVTVTALTLYDQDKKPVAQNIASTATTATWTADIEQGQTKSYYLTATTSIGESGNSNIAAYTEPRQQVTIIVEGFSVKAQ